jgi:hypothetical protein
VIHRFASIVFLPRILAAVLLLGGGVLPARGADDAAPLVLEPLTNLSQETKTELKFVAKAKGAKLPPLRFSLGKLRKNGQDGPVPTNMKLDAGTGAFSWRPTASQAGMYDLTVAVTDAKGQTASTTIRLTVRERSICAAPGAMGDLLRKWHAEGTAAGNTGDFYDNRDRDHSPLDLSPYPQLDVVVYTEEQKKQRVDWAAQGFILKQVTFGNSSTSAPVLQGGSNPRHYHDHPRGVEFLYQEYRNNNFYIYPAHHDHHPGHNGKPFYGDVYAANCPYLITSQGSSGSDQPFMRAIPYTLAAFRPEVKKKLIETGLLMPTLQMVFRSTNKHLKEPKEYLTGKAHPPVFDGSWVNDLKMVQTAHEITLENIPPMIQLKVVEEDAAAEGKDYFEPGKSEKLCETPASIGRVVRGRNYVRRMVVSAKESFDVNKKPLTYTWVVLRGDADRIQIKPRDANASVVELLVPYHERWTAETPVKIETNRVDIGAFVHNGTYYSAPGFVTFFSLDDEVRTYAATGRLLEIGYGVGDTELSVSNWEACFEALKADKADWATQLLKKQFKAEELAGIVRTGAEYKPAARTLAAARVKSEQAASVRQKTEADLRVAEANVKAAQKAHELKPSQTTRAELERAKAEHAAAEAARKLAEVNGSEAQKEVEACAKAVADMLNLKRAGLELPVKDLLERALRRLQEDPDFYLRNQQAVDDLFQEADAAGKGRFTTARKRLIELGLFKLHAGTHFQLKPLRQGPGPIGERLTRYEKNMLERFLGELLSGLVYPKFVAANFKANFVDQRLSTPKTWRDVYRYDAKGHPLGWTRLDEGGAQEFNADGFIVLEKDGKGRARKARSVKYEYDDSRKRAGTRIVRQVQGDQVVQYEYDGDDDWKGHMKVTPSAEP